MKEILSNYFKLSVLMNIIYLIFGLLLFFNPEGVIVSISIIIGILGIIFGIFEMMIYFNVHSQTALISGVFSLIAGIVLVLNTDILATIIPIIIGIGMVIQGVKKLDLAAKFKEQEISNWGYMLLVATLNFLCGIFFIVNPIMGAVVTTQVIGIIIVVYAVASIVDIFIFKDKVKKITKVIEETR